MNEPGKAIGQVFWKEHFESWKASGLTQQAYCKHKGISYQSFVYQHSRANRKLKKSAMNFLETKIKSVDNQNSASGLQVMLPNGVSIGFNGKITADLVQTVFSFAGSIKC